jgi:hypothetical protein
MGRCRWNVRLSLHDHVVRTQANAHTQRVFVDFPDVPAKENSQILYDHYMPRAAAWYNTSSYGRLSCRGV